MRLHRAPLAVLALSAMTLFTGCDTLLGWLGGGPPEGRETIGRGYDIFGPYAQPSEVKDGRILDLRALERAGLVETRQIDEGDTQIISGETIDEYLTGLGGSFSVGGSYKAFSGSLSASFSQSTYQRFGQYFATIRSEVRKEKIFIQDGLNADELEPYLTDRFRDRVNDPDLDPDELFRDYGTHAITSLFTGGRLEYHATVNESQITTSREFGLVANAAFGVRFLEVEASAAFESTSEQQSYESNAETRVTVYPAGESSLTIATAQDYAAWEDAVRESEDSLLSAFDDGGLIPIWEFATDEARRAEIEEAFLAWGRRAEEALGLADFRSETMTFSFSQYGVWPRVNGDSDMDIDGSDAVDVNASVALSVAEDDHLVVTLTFDIAEPTGDRTRFAGTRTLRVAHSPSGRLVGVEGTRACNLYDQATGSRQTGTLSSGQCSLGIISWQADRTGDDADYVGLGGTLAVPVIVQAE